MGAIFIGPFCSAYSCLAATAKETTSACKNAAKYAISTLIF